MTSSTTPRREVVCSLTPKSDLLERWNVGVGGTSLNRSAGGVLGAVIAGAGGVLAYPKRPRSGTGPPRCSATSVRVAVSTRSRAGGSWTAAPTRFATPLSRLPFGEKIEVRFFFGFLPDGSGGDLSFLLDAGGLVLNRLSLRVIFGEDEFCFLRGGATAMSLASDGEELELGDEGFCWAVFRRGGGIGFPDFVTRGIVLNVCFILAFGFGAKGGGGFVFGRGNAGGEGGAVVGSGGRSESAAR